MTTKETREAAKHQVINITPVGLMNNNSTNLLRSSRKSGRYQGDLATSIGKIWPIFCVTTKMQGGEV